MSDDKQFLDYATSYRQSNARQTPVLRKSMADEMSAHAPLTPSQVVYVVRRLKRENQELKLRFAAMLTLMSEKGLISAEEAARLLCLPDADPSPGAPVAPLAGDPTEGRPPA